MKITICGSMAFYAEMKEVRDKLVAMGHEIEIPELADEAPAEFGGTKTINFAGYVEKNGGIDAFPADHKVWDMKRGAIEHHFEKIEWADALLICNYEKRGVPGYVGGNTLIEIGVGFYLKKPIYLLYPVSAELSYKVEILGMKPVILDGEVSHIK